MKFSVPIKVPSKSNSYRIHRAGSRQWIAPSDEVVAAERAIALFARTHLPDFTGPVTVTIGIHGRIDIDNCAKVLLDGLQLSGRIANDSQVEELHIKRYPGKNEVVHIEVTANDPL